MDAAALPRCGAPVVAPRLRTRRSLRATRAAAAPEREGGAPGTRLFVARKFGIDVEESATPGRRLRDYVRLPADRYNVLDSRAVTRVSDTAFRVSTGMQKMLMFEAEPVGYIEIRVLAEGVEQQLTRAELLSPKPNRMVDELNATLSNLQLTNTVTAADSPAGGKQLVCQARAHWRAAWLPPALAPPGACRRTARLLLARVRLAMPARTLHCDVRRAGRLCQPDARARSRSLCWTARSRAACWRACPRRALTA
jgi:hypothetical protein